MATLPTYRSIRDASYIDTFAARPVRKGKRKKLFDFFIKWIGSEHSPACARILLVSDDREIQVFEPLEFFKPLVNSLAHSPKDLIPKEFADWLVWEVFRRLIKNQPRFFRSHPRLQAVLGVRRELRSK